jgi:hypothetical protein
VNVKQAAALYISKGWRVVPLAPGTKAATAEKWLEIVFKVEDFEDNDNIGIRSVGGLVITDLDCQEAVALADNFLPRTPCVWGRRSRPRSKRIYKVKDASLEKIIAFKDVENGTNFLELRVNHQDMAPPSTWTDKVDPNHQETLEWVSGWENLGEPAPVGADEIVRQHKLLATACAVARYYAPPGSRHEWGLALAGTLRGIEITEHEAREVVDSAGRYANDPNIHDRLTDFRTTYARGEDEAVAGAKKLEELGSGKLVATLRKTWGVETVGLAKSLLERLNEKHAVLFDQGGNLLVMTETDDELRYSKPSIMPILYPQMVPVRTNQKGTVVYAPLGDVWLRHPHRREYSGIELCPNNRGPKPGYYNLWKGFAIEPKKGEWPLFYAHIKEVMARGDEQVWRYILAWLAETYQHPDRPIGTVLVFRGGQGTGKSTFAKWVGYPFGRHFLHLDSTQRLTGNFNAHLHNTILLFADEAVWAKGKAGLGALKRMVTEDTLTIERKNIDTITVRNMIHMIVATNEQHAWPSELDERRGAVFDISRRRQKDYAYFAALEDELFNRGGLQAMMYDLLEWPDVVDLRITPNTGALRDQKVLSMEVHQAWWFEVLSDGTFWIESNKDTTERYPEPHYNLDRDAVYEHFLTAAGKANRFSVHGTKIMLAQFLRDMLPDGYPRQYQRKSSGKRYWTVPSLEVCQRYYVENVNRDASFATEERDGDAKERTEF